MPWRLRLTDMLGRALRCWQLNRRPMDSGLAKAELKDAAAVGLPGQGPTAPPARNESSEPAASQAARPGTDCAAQHAGAKRQPQLTC
jgi:hypothetical protein